MAGQSYNAVCLYMHRKQRKKLHDLLRQSLRNERNTMASMANGPPIYNPSLENVQFVNVSHSRS